MCEEKDWNVDLLSRINWSAREGSGSSKKFSFGPFGVCYVSHIGDK